MELIQILENTSKNKIYGLIGNIDITTNSNNYFIINDYRFPGTTKEYLNSPKDIKALQMSFLNESYLSKNISDLSISEIKKINLAKSLISNKEYLIFDYIDKDLTSNEKAEFHRLIKRLANDYNKTIILFTNDLTFFWEIADYTIYITDNNITMYPKKDLTILNYISKPNIIKFIDLIKAKNIPITEYLNTSDLLKAIYRLKEN